MFPRLIWDGRRQPSVLRTARSHLCVQWSAKPCSDIRHPSTRPRIQGMYQICQRAWHINASQPPLITKRCHSFVSDIWLLINVSSNMISPSPWGNNHSLRSKSLLISSWSLLSSYYVTKLDFPAGKMRCEKLHLLITKCLFDELYSCCLVVMHYCFYIEQQQTFSVLLLDEVCLWIVYSLSFPFMFLTFCR